MDVNEEGTSKEPFAALEVWPLSVFAEYDNGKGMALPVEENESTGRFPGDPSEASKLPDASGVGLDNWMGSAQ